MSEFTATVREIANGYIVTYGDQEYFTPQFDIVSVLRALSGVDHEKALRDLVMAFDGQGNKISAIRAVRNYCVKNNYDKFQGLRDAKEYVEHLRNDWYYAPLGERDAL